MKKFFKRFFAVLGILILAILVIGTGFLYLSPQFGGTVSDEQNALYDQTGHHKDGVFTNYEEINMQMDCHSIKAMLRETLNPDPEVAPAQNIEVEKFDAAQLLAIPDTATRITWLGHSSFLIETAGKVILLDPVFGQYAAPHPMLGRARFHKKMPITIDEIPRVDCVIISHDHYDHLDYESIAELKDKTEHFFVPLGIGNHLRRWEVAEEDFTEMDWWDEANYEDVNIVLTPSRHMSGRGLADQSTTLWGSWIVKHDHANMYFSGDGGYGKHFKEIGAKYGPFDIGLMECGQYNDLWRDVHMMPEESVAASQDVKAKVMIPIHWGSFALATHSWKDPAIRVTAEAAKRKVKIATPKIGESVFLLKAKLDSYKRWWE